MSIDFSKSGRQFHHLLFAQKGEVCNFLAAFYTDEGGRALMRVEWRMHYMIPGPPTAEYPMGVPTCKSWHIFEGETEKMHDFIGLLKTMMSQWPFDFTAEIEMASGGVGCDGAKAVELLTSRSWCHRVPVEEIGGFGIIFDGHGPKKGE